MGLWDRMKRAFQPAPVVTALETRTPGPAPSVAPVAPITRTYDPRSAQTVGLGAGPPPPGPPAVRNRELEAVIAADPSAIEPYLVYADWLLERGDPRGELIVLHHRMASAGPDDRAAVAHAARRLLVAHRAHLVGPAIAYAGALCVVEMRLGFVRSVRLSMDGDDAARFQAWLDAEDHPATRFLEAIEP